MSWWEFVAFHRADLQVRLYEHLAMSGFAVGAAASVGIPIGVLLSDYPRAARLSLAMAGIAQTIPSLALLGLLMVLTGQIGYLPSLIALFAYSLLPIFQNAIVGAQQVPLDVREAAEAMGMRRSQILWRVTFPLALPVILAGLRTATVTIVGTATLCAFIGAGGLGVFINRGLETVNPRLVLLGVIPVCLIALILDQALAFLGRRMTLKP